METKEYKVELKMVICVTCDNETKIKDAIKELSENIDSCDLISTNGCIQSGFVDEYIFEELN